MVELVAKSAGDGLLPVTIGKLSLTEEVQTALTSLMPFKGGVAALETALGAGLPGPGESGAAAGGRVLWFGQNQYMLVGGAVEGLGDAAAVTDQSDAWVVVRLEGEGCEDVLARLVPLDLRPQVFAEGRTARTELMHMMSSVTRVGPQAFMIMVFRSMAATLVHDLKTAMQGVTARR